MLELAKETGVTLQQIQKYELGASRVCAARLFLISKVLNVHIADLYANDTQHSASAKVSLKELSILRNYREFPEPIQDCMFRLVQVMNDCTQSVVS